MEYIPRRVQVLCEQGALRALCAWVGHGRYQKDAEKPADLRMKKDKNRGVE